MSFTEIPLVIAVAKVDVVTAASERREMIRPERREVLRDGLKSTSVITQDRVAKVKTAPNLPQKIVDAEDSVSNATVRVESSESFLINDANELNQSHLEVNITRFLNH